MKDSQRDLTQYKFSCTLPIFNYLKDNDVDKLINRLKEIEIHARDNYSGEAEDISEYSLWFKFFSGDTLATDIRKIENTLRGDTIENYNHLIECFKISIKLSEEIEVYFS